MFSCCLLCVSLCFYCVLVFCIFYFSAASYGVIKNDTASQVQPITGATPSRVFELSRMELNRESNELIELLANSWVVELLQCAFSHSALSGNCRRARFISKCSRALTVARETGQKRRAAFPVGVRVRAVRAASVRFIVAPLLGFIIVIIKRYI